MRETSKPTDTPNPPPTPSVRSRPALVIALMCATVLLALFAQITGPVIAENVQDILENNFDRPGGDYRRITMPFSKPEDCRSACFADAPRCKAWTFARAGSRDNAEVCVLKESVSLAQPDPCCVSGRMQMPDPHDPTAAPTAPTPPEPAPMPPGAPPGQVMGPPGPPSDNGSDYYGVIGTKYAALGGANGFLGLPVENQADAAHGGRCRLYRHGMICFHAEIGEAYAVWGMIFAKWAAIGKTEFGYPITDERVTSDGRGRYNHFRGMQYPNRPESSIYWTPQTGAHEIYGAIRDAWAKQGWERGPLGYPTSGEHQDGKYRRVNFERGFIRWAPDTGIEVMK